MTSLERAEKPVKETDVSLSTLQEEVEISPGTLVRLKLLGETRNLTVYLRDNQIPPENSPSLQPQVLQINPGDTLAKVLFGHRLGDEVPFSKDSIQIIEVTKTIPPDLFKKTRTAQ